MDYAESWRESDTSDDKCQITCVLAVSMAGNTDFPRQDSGIILKYLSLKDGIFGTVTTNEIMKWYFQKVIIPFVTKSRPALALYNCFQGQITPSIEKLLEQNNMISVPISPNHTDKLQLID